jgi:CO/xanthine dehydrogenase Mo-binding subunit
MRGNLMAGYLAMKWKRPVKSKFPYLQQLTAKGNRKTEHMTCKGGAKKDGTLQAFSISTTMDMGSLGGDSSTAVQMMEQWWNCPNMYLTGQAAATDTPPQGSIRCVQHPRPFVLVSMHWDRLAEGVGMDPTDFLIKNAFKGVGNGAVQETAATEYTSNPFAPFAGGPDYVTQLVTASAWKSKWKGWKTPTSVSGSKQTGIGFAMHMCSHGSLGSPESAYIKLDPDGTFLLNCGSNDIGQGSRTALALIAAEELGISATQIRMNRVDTSYVAQSCAPSGSTITRGSGTAVVVAARNTKQMIFDTVLKGKLLTGATQETDMEIANGNVYLKSNPATTVPITSVASSMASLLGPIQGTGASAVPGGITNRQYSACVAEVTVDTDTGEVSLDTLTHMLCPGRVIWYNGAVSQVCGGLIMGQGHAMFEGMVKDVLTGRTLNASYIDYKIPTIADLPTINVNFFENLDPYGPLGAVGISEPIITSIPPAIGNAIYNACGVRMTAQPFTPEKILAGLGKA